MNHKEQNRIFVIVLLILLGMMFFIKESKGDVMGKCRGKCLDQIDIEECVRDELLFYDTDNMKNILKNCKVLIRNEHEYCMEECREESKNAKSRTKRG